MHSDSLDRCLFLNIVTIMEVIIKLKLTWKVQLLFPSENGKYMFYTWTLI